MPTRYEVLEALRSTGLSDFAEVFERVADFVEGVAKVTGGEVLGYATKVFPGTLVLNVFLDGAVLLGRDALLVVEATGTELGIRIEVESEVLEAGWADCVSIEDLESSEEVYVCTEKSHEEANVFGRALRRYATKIAANRVLYIVARPTWHVVHIWITSADRARKLIDVHGISINL